MFESPAFQRVLERLARETLHDPFDAEVRMVVQMRARDACEYCLMPTRTRFEVDHVIPVSQWCAYLDGGLLFQPRESDRAVLAGRTNGGRTRCYGLGNQPEDWVILETRTLRVSRPALRA
jgi:hypothetical protein